MVPSAKAAITATWTGATNSAWGTATNWACAVSGTLPKSGDTAVFNGAGNGHTTVALSSGLGINWLTFDTADCASYTIGLSTDTLSFNTSGGITVNSTVVNDQTVAANLVMGINSGGGNIQNYSTAATLNLTGTIGLGTNVASSTVTIKSVGKIKISGIIIDASGDYTRSILVTGTAGQSGTTTFSGNNSYLGTTKVYGGTLLVNGDQSAATGAVTVSGTGTGASAMTAFLGGNGTIGGATTISGTTAANAATLSAGETTSSIGKLTFASSLTLSNNYVTTIFQINGNQRGVTYDAIDVGGALALGGALTLDIESVLANGTYDLFNFTEGDVTGGFSSVTITGGVYNGYTFTETSSGIWTASVGETAFTYTEATGDLTLVPEPQTWALVGMGLGAFLFASRRRRASSL